MSPDGLITAKALGHTVLKASTGELESFSHIMVIPEQLQDEPFIDNTPPVEVSSQISIVRSDYKHDVSTGLSTQNIELTNNGSWPISYPSIVISELPLDVKLVNFKNKTRVVNPIGSAAMISSYFLAPDSGFAESALMPNQTVKLQLRFSNRNLMPIDYQLRVFEQGGGI